MSDQGRERGTAKERRQAGGPPETYQSTAAPVPGRPGKTERTQPSPPTPPTAKAPLSQFLGVVDGSLEQLSAALILIAERHERDYDVASTATVLAGWIHEDTLALAPFKEHYGVLHSDQPARIRSGLLGGVRTGLLGLMTDLTDLSLLTEQVELNWKILHQAGKELHDDALLAVSASGQSHARRTLRWIRTMLDHAAPEALTSGANPAKEARGSLPKGTDRVAAIPDPVWGPLAAGVMIVIVGAVGLLAGRPWLLPSLGPSAAIAAEMPAHPSTRPWNTFVGHIGGLVAGFIGVFLAGATNQPSVLVDHQLTAPRVAASVIAVALTLLLGGLLKASHPPAAATTLLVSLGAIRTPTDVVNLVGGVVVIAVVAALFREVRVHRVAPAERFAAGDSMVRRFLRRSGA